MISKILLHLLGFIPFVVNAQFNISTQLPPAGVIQKEQLWNVTMINNSNEIADVSLKLSLQDVRTAEVIFSASSGNITVGKGVTVLKSSDLQPITYNYSNLYISGNYLPMGAYIACYQVFKNVSETPVLLAEECSQINIDPLSPPLLNVPADQSVIESPYPMFSWTPPTPYDMFSNLNYELTVAEVLPGQSPIEAIQYNTPIYTRSNILQTNDIYPSTFEKLDTGKIYAWQVAAANATDYAVKTEVWTFSLSKENMPKVSAENDTYILLETGTTGVYTVHKNMLHVKFFSFEGDHFTPFVFTDRNGNVISKINTKLSPGENTLDFKISKGFQVNTLYTLTITGENNRKYFLTFNIK